jgi:uncharacterized protein (UPF0297 family)
VIGVPNQPKTPIKCFRIPEDLYRRAQVAAAERDEILSEEIRKFLERYTRKKARS